MASSPTKVLLQIVQGMAEGWNSLSTGDCSIGEGDLCLHAACAATAPVSILPVETHVAAVTLGMPPRTGGHAHFILLNTR